MPFTPALAQRIFPSRHLVREIGVVLGGVLLVAALAQLAVPMGNGKIPLTGQSLGVFSVGALLGFRRGSIAVLAYVLLGAAGVPVFANFSGGLEQFTGPSGGYLVGFVLAAGTVGLLAEHGFLDSYRMAALTFVIASLPIYVVGLAWYMHFVSPAEAFHKGFLVFLPGAAIKIALAAAIVGRYRPRAP